MELFLITTLLVSCAGLVILLSLKRFEMRSGKLIMGSVRPKVGGVMHSGVVFVESVLPALFIRSAKRLLSGMNVWIQKTFARAIVFFEQTLRWMLDSIHEMTTKPRQGGGPASAFLREVAEHKRKLQKRSAHKRAILDE